MSSVNDIRATFLDYFGKNGHEIVASSPLVPQNDPTLMFANSGMVQFKNLLLVPKAVIMFGRQPRRNVFVLAANIMILKMLATRRVTTHFLRCLVIFRLAIISRKMP